MATTIRRVDHPAVRQEADDLARPVGAELFARPVSADGTIWQATRLNAGGVELMSMPRTPSIVPGNEQDVYLVVDDLGKVGTIWREADTEATDYENVN